jgi:antitoxin component YwqK of YwqJK toxin-antitoxin module
MKARHLITAVLLVAGCGPTDGPYEIYHENGQLERKGTLNMGEKCGEWIEDGETVTYDPC